MLPLEILLLRLVFIFSCHLRSSCYPFCFLFMCCYFFLSMFWHSHCFLHSQALRRCRSLSFFGSRPSSPIHVHFMRDLLIFFTQWSCFGYFAFFLLPLITALALFLPWDLWQILLICYIRFSHWSTFTFYLCSLTLRRAFYFLLWSRRRTHSRWNWLGYFIVILNSATEEHPNSLIQKILL